MPVYTLQGPDGKTYDIEGPEGATAEQLGQFVLAQNQQQSAPLNLGEIKGTAADPIQQAPQQPQQAGDASFAGRFGMGVMDPVHGGAQALTHMLPEGVVNAVNSGMQAVNDAPVIGPVTRFLGMTPATSGELDKRIQQREQDYQAARKSAGQDGIDWARLGGNIAPTIAMGMGGSLLKAGANAIGRPGLASNIFAKVASGAGSSALPGALMPVTEGDYADEKTRQMTLAAALGAAFPAVAQAAPAVRSLIDPFSKGGQDRIVGGAIRNAAGNDADQALINLRNASEIVPGSSPTAGQAAGNAGIASLERTATQTDPIAMNMMANRLEQQNIARQDLLSNIRPDKNIAAEVREAATNPLYQEAYQTTVSKTPELKALLNRPSMKQALNRAQELADELGQTFNPEKMTGRDAHYLKMALDDLSNASPMSGIGGNELRAIQGTRAAYLQELEKQIPAYGQARQSYAELSKPLNQADLIKEIGDKATNFRGTITPAALARALQDKTAQSVTGQKNATLQSVLTKDQIDSLNNVLSDVMRADFAQTAGRGVGSDTVQKLAYSNIINKTGIPSMLGGSAIAGVGGRIADTAYKRANEELRQKLAQALQDPKETARLIEKATPSEKLRLLSQALGQVGTVSGAVAYPTAKRTAETEN